MVIQMNERRERWKGFFFTLGWSARLESLRLLTNHYIDILRKDSTTANQRRYLVLKLKERSIFGEFMHEHWDTQDSKPLGDSGPVKLSPCK